jgi:hypothetical protein
MLITFQKILNYHLIIFLFHFMCPWGQKKGLPKA